MKTFLHSAPSLAFLLLIPLGDGTPETTVHPAPDRSTTRKTMPHAAQLPKEVYYYGHEGQQPAQVPLRAGPLRLLYEAGNLRYVRLGEREVVRMIYPTLRDRNWGTYLPTLRNEKIEQTANSFRISYENHYDSEGIQYRFRCVIEGKPDGTIRFELDGEALSTFLKNRLGICVLHPIAEHAGRSGEITRPDGSQYTGKFPVDVQPDQPFKDIRTMRWEVAPNCFASLAFGGEVFETEDQRNYGDASFKTYCTPQDRPKPAEVKQGDRLRQTVELTLGGTVPAVDGPPTPLQLTISEGETTPLPAIGTGRSSEVGELSAGEIERLKALKLAHYRVDVAPAQPDWTTRLQAAVRESRQLGLPLEVMLYPGTDPVADANAFLRECPSERVSVQSITVFQKGDLSPVVRALKEGYPNTPVGTGANGVFMGLNATRTIADGAEFVAYAVDPQIHLFDNTSIVENLAGQGFAVPSARKLGNGRPVYVTPVTLKPSRRPATGPVAGDALPRSSDVRQMSLFGAACTVGSLKALAEAGAASVTYYETVGTQGLMQAGAPVAPAVFKAPAGAAYPLYHVLRSAGEFGPARVLKSTSNRPLTVDGLVLSNRNARRILLANYTGQEQTVRVGPLKGNAQLRTLDETNVSEAMSSPETYAKEVAQPLSVTKGYTTLRLKPYATAVVDTRE
ncbi:MAG: hypothetical protein H7Z75_00650 [Ferruginibacter sp.]|nr:hypothetical protein [Cytophagales bacterium]